MAIDPPEFPTVTRSDGCASVAIGQSGDLLFVGDSFEREYAWTIDEVVDDVCTETPADFTGYLPTALILDASDATLDTFTVVPSPGDATGIFTVSLTPAQTTTAIRDNAVAWSLTITAGAVNRTLIKAPFKVT